MQDELSPTPHVYKSVGQCDIGVDVYSEHTGLSLIPAIIMIHGGALIEGSRKWVNPRQIRRFLDLGCTVMSIDYRLAPETKLPEIIEDLKDFFVWVRDVGSERFFVDPGRLGVFGYSAGGYLTLMAGVVADPRPKALVSLYGYGDIVADWYRKPDPFYCQHPRVSVKEAGADVVGPVTAETYDGRGKEMFYLYCRQRGIWLQEVGGVDPDESPKFFVPYCPQYNVSFEYPPTLLLHGTKDTDVPFQQSVDMAGALDQAGVENRLIAIEGAGHGFDAQEDRPEVKAAVDAVVAFFGRHLKGTS